VSVATAAPRFGIPNCNSAFADKWGGRLSHTPSGDTFAAEADEPLDRPESCGKLDVVPRKLRTSDGQASDAEFYPPLRGAFISTIGLRAKIPTSG
jgi:hypothetical protein